MSDNSEEFVYSPTRFENVFNFFLCRCDLINQKLEFRPVTLIQLFRYAVKLDYLLLLIGFICSLISGVSQPIMAIISGRITNALLVYDPLSPEFKKKAMENVYIFLAIGIFVSLNDFCQYMCFQRVCSRIMTQMRNRYIKSVLRQNSGWFDKNLSGTITTRLNDNMERIHEGIGDKLGVLIRGFSMVITSVIISLCIEWRLALMMMGLIPISTICMTLLSKFMETSVMKEMEKTGIAGAIAEESLMGVRTVQSLNGQEEMIGRYREQLNSGKKYAIWGGFWNGFFGGLFFFWLISFMGCGILYGGYLLSVGIIKSPGDVLIVTLAMMLGAYFLGLISPHMMVLLNARVSAASIYQTIDRVPEIDAYSKEGKILEEVKGKVQFQNVHFQYPSRQEVKVLDGLELTVEPGTSVALVGHSGCGKSTTVGLLTRLYESEAGNVTIDGTDVRELNIDFLRNIVGIVQQEPVLFNDTIQNNLLIGNPTASREKMIEVCKMANAHDFIEKMPKGYDTLIGDGGVQLSGGQKQRVAIARTLIRDPKVLLLDEATSALDAESESIVQSALNNVSKGRTTIMIAHRLSTIREADKIVFFEKGTIVESGTHDDLVRLGGRYYDLVKAQQFMKDEIVEKNSRKSSIQSEIRRNSFNRSSRQSIKLSKTEEILKKPTHGYLDIIKNADGNYLYLFIGLISALIRGLDLPAYALLFGWVFEGFEFVPYGDRMMHRFSMAVIAFVTSGVGIWVFQTISTLMFTIVSENLGVKFRVSAFKNLLYQDAAYFDRPENSPGHLITKLAADPPNIKAVVDGRMMQVIYALSSLLACIVIGFVNCWQVATLGTCLVLFLGCFMVSMAYKVSLVNEEHMINDEAGKVAIEIIENVRSIQLLTRTTRFADNYANESEKRKRTELRKSVFEGINYSITQNFMCYMSCFCFALAIRVINLGEQTPDKAYKALMAFMMCSEGVVLSSQFFPEFVKAKTSANQLFQLINRKPATGDVYQGSKKVINGNVTFENVNFSYHTDQSVMKGLQWTALRGQTVALVGPSGSGKSTCIGMLERFYDVTGGVLRIDGQDIRSLSLHHLRTQMSLVGQEPRLFSGTIRENVCLGIENVSLEKINHALELANANRFLSNLPAGIDTEVGEKGSQLSGGQKQRIAIARALVRDPKILLLDEATSALDSESEKAVQEALDRAREGRTCITIAHRLSSIQNSDLIVYIDKGHVQESGTHAQLMSLKGSYYDLIKKQDLAI